MNDTLVIRTVFNKELARAEEIELGDLIFSVNGMSLRDFYSHKSSNRISTSNENYLRAILEPYYLLSNEADSLKIGLLKKDKRAVEKYIKLRKFSDYTDAPLALNAVKMKSRKK